MARRTWPTHLPYDAFFLAKLLILGILPEGYIYPKDHRPVRDLARKRMFLVRHKTANILSLQSFIQRCCCVKISTGDIRNLKVEALEGWLEKEYLVLSAQASLDTINFLKEKIKRIEKAIIQRVKLNKGFRQFLTIPGI